VNPSLFFPGLVAATGLAWLAMYATATDWLRNLLYRIPFLRRLLVCPQCTGAWAGFVLYRMEPGLAAWWFVPAASGFCWLFSIVLVRLLGLDPLEDTGRQGEKWMMEHRIGTPWEWVEIVESNRLYIVFRDITEQVEPIWGTRGLGHRTMTAKRFDALYHVPY